MLLYRVSTPPFREGLATLVEKSELGEALIEEDGKRRWIPADWIVEEDS